MGGRRGSWSSLQVRCAHHNLRDRNEGRRDPGRHPVGCPNGRRGLFSDLLLPEYVVVALAVQLVTETLH